MSITMKNVGQVPEILKSMLNGKMDNAIRFTQFFALDTSLQGRAGDTVKLSVWDYIGKADITAEGDDIQISEMGYTDRDYTIQKYTKGVNPSTEFLNSTNGNPIAQIPRQIQMSIVDAIEADCVEALCNGSNTHEGTGVISHSNVVDAIDHFQEEVANPKVMFIHPKQLSQLRVDAQFISATEKGYETMITGEIGTIASVRLISSRRVKKVGDVYKNPIIQLRANTETEEDVPVGTIFLKRNSEAHYSYVQKNDTHLFTGIKEAMPAVTNETRLVVLEVDAAV